MQETNVVELKKHMKQYLDAVESGEVIRVCRNGKPIAEIVPIPKSGRSWTREVPCLSIKGLSSGREVLKDYREFEL